ncbi:tetratricopeptide repeat protein [Lachnotalea glycerini]|uniref:Tetratricopeptide repeat protein n=1 Tax=Lachnotalea glycerini TaxID=1763509 RepID=A0A318EP53_9FIRM|nr:hypothetical protein [Lachnotalea glycerini]PXV91865.1 tetratricopeptide repeat protein [Lachnotalea glycerini]
MDKYEYRIKADQIRKLVNEENFAAAMKLADTIDWRRVKNVSMLCTVSDIYEKNGKYEESHELLLMAYDRSPIGRMMVYKLAELAIKMEDYDEAIDYYREFVHLSPEDIAADILKYKIYKAKGTKPEELIPIMETFKEREYHEEWAYELAHLYHEAGMGSKCVEECDEIILWFSEGKFVEKAMELKMLYKPLSLEQQEKYDHRYDAKEEIHEYLDEDGEEEELRGIADSSKVELITEDMFSDAVDANDIQIKPVNLGKYDTINLQAELAKSMEQIMSATEKEAVDSTMENIRRMVEDSQILDINFDEELDKNEIISGSIQVEVPAQMEMVSESIQDKINYEKVLAEENDGQISLYMPEANILEKQITGQMRIEDVLNEWEKMKSAAEVAIKEAELKRLNDIKGNALQKAEHIMSKLSLIISEDEMKANGQEIADALKASFLEDDEAFSQIAASLEGDALNQINENAENFEDKKEVSVDISNELEALENIIAGEEDTEDKFTDLELEKVSEAAIHTIEANHDIEEENSNEIEKSEPTDPELMIQEVQEEDRVVESTEDKITANLQTDIEAIIADELDSTPEEYKEERSEHKEPENKEGLTKEQQGIFAAFLSVRGVEKALCNIFNPINKASSSKQPFDVGYIAVIGEEQTGKTTLAMAIAKAVQMAQHKKSAKVAKISANSLNTKDIKMLSEKMEGGVLIIEKAGSLTEKTIKNLMETLRECNEEILLILEDAKAGIEAVLNKDKDFENQFSAKIELPDYNNDELVEFGKDYAKMLMYSIDDMAILALYTCLGNIQTDDKPITIEQVKGIIDTAIAHSNKKTVKKLKDIVMKRRYDEDKRVILQECDFESIG